MKTFREFLLEQEEAAATKRQNMIHFQKMKPVEFINFVKKIKDELGGSLDKVRFSMKVDGLGARFGKDVKGRIFFEGSRTGPVYDSGAFSAHVKNKGSAIEIVNRATHYDDMLELFKSSKFMTVVPNDRKVTCEIFYNPMATEDDNGITFVNVKYDKSKLGSLMTIIPISVVVSSTGEEAEDSAEIIADLLEQSNSKIKIVSADLKASGINISGLIDPISSLDDYSIRILNSRLKADAEEKANLTRLIDKVKDDLAEYILNHKGIVGKFKFGPEIEGIVLDIDGKNYKITTSDFKQALAAKRIK